MERTDYLPDLDLLLQTKRERSLHQKRASKLKNKPPKELASKSALVLRPSMPAYTDVVSLDHGYCKLWNSQSDQSFAKNAIYLTWDKPFERKTDVSESSNRCADVNEVDIEHQNSVEGHGYEIQKAEILMKECEKHVKIARPAAAAAATEEAINRAGWNQSQHRLFNRVYKALMMHRLARLSFVGQVNEAILRRNNSNKCAQRLRQIFSGVFWNNELLTWLHSILMEHLSVSILPDYIESLQTLKAKNSVLIDKMVTQSTHYLASNPQLRDAFQYLLKRPWDPIQSAFTHIKLDKLPRNAVILMVPMIPYMDKKSNCLKSRRVRNWNNYLITLAKVIHVSPLQNKSDNMWNDFDMLVTNIRIKIIEIRISNPSKPIILLGWRFGALLATYVSSIEPVDAAVGLAFPYIGLKGVRGDADDLLLDSQSSTLFVIGENAQSSPVPYMEDLREHMKVDNSMIVVRGAGDKLIVNNKTKRENGITQQYVDHQILTEVHNFLTQVLTTNPTPTVNVPSRQGSPTQSTIKPKKYKKLKRKLCEMVKTEKIVPGGVGDGYQIISPHNKIQLPTPPKKAKKSRRIPTTLYPHPGTQHPIKTEPHTHYHNYSSEPSPSSSLDASGLANLTRPIQPQPSPSPTAPQHAQYVQFTANHGNSFSMPLEKARQLFHLGELKTKKGVAVDPNKLVSIPTSLLSHLTHTNPPQNSISEDRNNRCRTTFGRSPQAPATQHIRQLLSTDVTAAMRYRHALSESVAPLSQRGDIPALSDHSGLTKSLSSITQSLNQSLIRKPVETKTRTTPIIQPKISTPTTYSPSHSTLSRVNSGSKVIITPQLQSQPRMVPLPTNMTSTELSNTVSVTVSLPSTTGSTSVISPAKSAPNEHTIIITDDPKQSDTAQ